ncbi:hypothetical protein CLIB1444_12S03532 [[Candida] jaroonii]|uniref:Uncharacterized protein n=1 Tax=[Candida] jaroonii TaxID=467808 RepID=A0ACA9YEC9_9ASCO|nr:hypothetical protein CLIB1444_12S03532 [[Candida] jaroonii]
MEYYDSSLLSVLAPLIVIQCNEHPEVLKYFESFDISGNFWHNSILRNRLSNLKFLIRSVKENQIIEHLEKDPPHHSILSPFNINSDTFPNGILTYKWFKKYQETKPFVVVNIMDLPSDPLDDEALTSKINDMKNSYSRFGIKLVVIIISANKEVSDDDDRLNRLRQLTGLTRSTGLVYINQNKKDEEMIISSLLNNLKTSAVDFYSDIELKIKKRSKKYYTVPSSSNIDTTIELTPKFLETRNLIKQGIINQYLHPHSLESSIKSFEISYTNLIEILKDNYFEFAKDSISDHDLKIYHQLRILIDIVAFHIVRCYLSIDEPIIAIKKHQAHIINVKSAINNRIDLNQWISIQYCWLNELLDLVPNAGTKHKQGINFYGGVKYDSFEIFTNPSLIILQAVNHLKPVKPHQLNYLSDFTTEDLKSKKLALLKKASKFDNQHSLATYINFQIAEELFKANDNDCLKYYEKSVSDNVNINNIINSRLIKINQNLGNLKESLILILQSNCKDTEVPMFEQPVDLNVSFFDIETLFIDRNNIEGKVSDVSVYDELVGQIKFKPKVTLEGELNIDKVTVHFNSNIEDMIFNHDGSKECQKVSFGDGNFSLKDFEILEFSKVIEKSGTYQIESIEVESTLKIKTTIIHNKEKFSKQKIKPYDYYMKKVEGKFIPVPVKLPSVFSNSIKVSPIKPNVVISMINPVESIVIGEKIDLKFKIGFKNERHLSYHKVSLNPRIKVIEDDSIIDSKINWEGLKDDESLVLDNLNTDESIEKSLNLSIFYSSLQSVTDKSYQVKIDLKLLVEEDKDDDLIAYESASYIIPILKQPFLCKFAISPKYRHNEDMPNPFILHGKQSMPIVTRVWSGKLNIVGDMEIVKVDYSIKPQSSEIVVDILPESDERNQIFTTRSKNGISQRNVTMVINADIQWARPQGTINHYQTPEYEILLPLTDPRVLLDIEQHQQNVKLKYIIENPTPRIFQFQTKLVDENERFVWNFEESQTPLVLNKFPVLPFNRFIIEYQTSYNSTEELIQLPQLKVFDLQYKVSLPTLPVSNDIIIKENILYIKKQVE